MTDDAQLFRWYVDEQSAEAFAALVERHLPLVYRTALRLTAGDVHRAEDVTQNVFTLLARKAATLRDHGCVAGWLYLATRRAARDVRRGEQRRKLREQGAIIMDEISGAGESQADWEALRPVLDEALGELGSTDREAVLLRFFKGQAFGEIGAALRVSEDAARMRVGRALEKLRERLERRGVKSTASALGLLLANDVALGAPAGLAAVVTQSALVSAATLTAAGVGAGVVGFMSTIKLVGVAALVVLTACVAVYEVGAKQAAEGGLESARREYAALLAKTEEAERAARLAEEGAREKRMQEKPAVSAALMRHSEDHAAETVAAGDALMALHPGLKAAVIAAERANVASYFSLLYRELNLSEGQRREFEDIMIRGNGAQTNWSGGPNDQITFWVRAEISAEQKEQKLRALLGHGGYDTLAKSDALTGSMLTALRAAGSLYDSETPLTREQGRALRELLARDSLEGARSPSQKWPAFLEEARAFLSESQLEIFTEARLSHELRQADEAVARREAPK